MGDIYRYNAGFVMSYEDYIDQCREAWRTEGYSHIYIHRPNAKNEAEHCVHKKNPEG